MGKKLLVCMAALIALVGVPSFGNALGVDLGPFSFRLDGGVYVDSPAFRFYNDPICRAIQEQKLIVMVVQNEGKTKQVVLEPYVFGYDSKKQLVLQGYQVESVDLAKADSTEANGEGVFGGVLSTFSGDNWSDINFDKVLSVKVIEDSTFQVREGVLDNLTEENKVIETVCIIQL